MAVEYQVHYFEPNNLEHNPEDLNVGVYFEVDVQKRGSFDSGTYKGEASFGFKPVNVFGGEDNLITTSYSDITMLELSNGGNTESIGIESINIKYNSWYFPEVNIKFVDVRGNALFNPMEMTNDPNSNAQGSFLSCLFMFPYPIFKITIKGYYGKPVTFNMTVRDVRANLNPQSGNFEISVNFIGYMYSYLTDVPMRYLFAAPYIKYDNVSSDLGKFHKGTSDENIPIPTFTEFIGEMSKGIESMENNSEITKAKETIGKCGSAKDHIGNIKNSYNGVKNLIINSCIIYDNNVEVTSVEDFFNKTDISQPFEIVYKGDEEEIVKNTPLSSLVDGLNSYVSSVQMNWEALKQTDLVYEEKDIQMILNPIFHEEVNNFPNDKHNHFLDNDEYLKVKFYMNYVSDMKLLENILGIAGEKSSKATSALEKAEEDVFNNTLSWRPTISNVFQMTLAHLDKFYENVSRCISNIENSNDSRLLSELDVETDCNTHGSELTVFPFPAFYDNENKYLWIGNTNAHNYPERYLVEHIINGSQLARDDMKEKYAQYDQNFNATFVYPQKGIPTLLYDVFYGNPYHLDNIDFVNLVTSPNDKELPEAAKIFVKRFLLKYYYYNESLTQMVYKKTPDPITSYKEIPYIPHDVFAKIEALNLLGEGNNLKAVKDSSFWQDPDRTNLVREYARCVIGEFSNPISDGGDTYRVVHKQEENIKDTLTKKSSLHSTRDIAVDISYWFNNTLKEMSLSEYNARMISVGTILSNEAIDTETYKKCFPLSSDSIKGSFEGVYFNSNSYGFVISSDKSFLDSDDIREYEEIKTVLTTSFDKNPRDNKNRLSPSSSNYFLNSLNKDDVIDFYPAFTENRFDAFEMECYEITKASLNERYENLKNTWLNRVFNFNKEKKLYYSFSCRRYPNMDTDEKLGNASDDIKLRVLDDFFTAIGFKNYDVNGLIKLEHSGIVKVPLLSMVYLGSRFSVLTDSETYNLKRYPIIQKAIEIYKENWKYIVDIIIQYVLSEKTANQASGNRNDDYVFCETDTECFVFRKLSENAIDKINNLFGTYCYIFNLHGCLKFERPITNDSATNDDFIYALNHAFTSFRNTIAEKCGLGLPESNIEDAPLPEDNAVSDDRKLGIYDTLKNLYDRWKFGCNRNGQGYGNLETQVSIKNFVFRNALNEDIGDKYNINIDKVVKLISSIYKGNTDMSVYSFLTEVTRIADCMMLSLPANVYEVMNSMDKMKELFTPYRYISAKEDAMQTTYIVTHRQKTSEHLDFAPNVSQYKNDGVTFKNKVCKSVEGNDEELGVFGVTYSLGNQRFFKDIKVGMDKPIVTEQSIAATMQIAEAGGSKGSNIIGRAYHDLFDTYSAHNYNCTVTTMGNAQIMPMMYFQLNNIGMFKGGYMIINVEHTLNNQGMTTTFIGNRISKYQFNLDTNNVWERDGIDNTEYGDNDDKNSSSSKFYVNGKRRKDVDNLAYSKENTTIIIDAGHYMSKAGKESPDLNPETDMFKMDDPERRGDGVLNPYDIYENETYRYREYWGNRKIANRLVEKLKTAGYTVKAMYESDKAAKDYYNFGGKTNSLYNDLKNQGKTMIIVSIHSDAAANGGWGSGNFWSIYCQRDDIPDVYNPKTSYTLAECIAKKASEIFEDPKNADILPVVGDKKMSVKTTPQTFTDEPGKKYRPTTMSHAPAVLSENLFHDTKSHVKFLGSQKGREMIAEIHYQGIVAFFDEMQKS